MATEQLKTLIQLSLSAMEAGGKAGANVTEDMQKAAHNPRLKAALHQGSEMAQQWATRIDQALQEAGGSDDQKKQATEAPEEVIQQMQRQAPDDDYSRDLGIIAASQLALHNWIASFGTLRAYAAQAGLRQTQQAMQTCLDEAKRADEQFPQLAGQLLRAS